jgi:hypothetical protein
MGDYGDYQRGELRGVDAVATKIVMMRNYPGNVSLAFLIVEGTTDKNLYQTYVNTTTCQIIPADGRDNVKNLLTILERESFKGVLAIVDADFDVLEEQAPHSPHLLFTDTHDLETMLIQSPALEKVLAELGSPQHLKRKIEEFSNRSARSVQYRAGPIGLPETCCNYKGFARFGHAGFYGQALA